MKIKLNQITEALKKLYHATGKSNKDSGFTFLKLWPLFEKDFEKQNATWEQIIHSMCDISILITKKGDKKHFEILNSGLDAFKQFIRTDEISLIQAIKDLCEITRLMEGDSSIFLPNLYQFMNQIINKKISIENLIKFFLKIKKELGPLSENFLKTNGHTVSKIITDENYKDINWLIGQWKEMSIAFFRDILSVLILYCPDAKQKLQQIRPFSSELYTKRKSIFLLSILPHTQYQDYIINLDAKGLINFLNDFNKDKRYFSVQGLNSMGYLCVHVTNAFGGGAALGIGEKRRSKPIENIINCIENQGTNKFQLSISTIRSNVRSKIAMTKRFEIDGSIGIVFDSGYIYESYSSDAGTITGTKESEISYRTGGKEVRVPTTIAVNKGGGNYNELLVRKWTVQGIFYTEGVQQEVITQLKNLANEYAGHETINPEWINREKRKKIGSVFKWFSSKGNEIKKSIKKKYPVYEIDHNSNTWKIVHNP
jgi:hypothetical protein